MVFIKCQFDLWNWKQNFRVFLSSNIPIVKGVLWLIISKDTKIMAKNAKSLVLHESGNYPYKVLVTSGNV